MKDRLFREGYRFSFFQVVHLLERLYENVAPLTRTRPLSEEPVRFQASPRRSFPAADIRGIQRKRGRRIRAVTQSEVVLFTVGLGFQEELRSGVLSERLRGMFREHGISLSEDIVVEEMGRDSLWCIHDGYEEETYVVVKEEDVLSVYVPEIVQMVLSFMGLYGVDSPLPFYFSEAVVGAEGDDEHEDGEEDGARVLRRFLDIFDHRIYSLYYRAWKKYRYSLQFETGGKDSFSQYLLSLIGLGTPALQCLAGGDPSRLIAYMGVLGQQTRCAEGLGGLLSDYFGVDAQIAEFVPRWVTIPESYRTRLGTGKLGQDATMGEKILDLGGKFRIILGPLNFEAFQRLLPSETGSEGRGTDFKHLDRLVRLYVRDQLSFDMELLLYSEDVPPLQLGMDAAQLGWISWAGRPSEDVVSVAFSFDRHQEEVSLGGR